MPEFPVVAAVKLPPVATLPQDLAEHLQQAAEPFEEAREIWAMPPDEDAESFDDVNAEALDRLGANIAHDVTFAAQR